MIVAALLEGIRVRGFPLPNIVATCVSAFLLPPSLFFFLRRRRPLAVYFTFNDADRQEVRLRRETRTWPSKQIGPASNLVVI